MKVTKNDMPNCVPYEPVIAFWFYKNDTIHMHILAT